MALMQFGYVVKNRRESLGLTQEELADGICSVPTLSRLENGERMPTKRHFEMLLQRLGYSDMTLNYYVDEREFYLHELKFRIRQANITNHPEQSRMLLEEFEHLLQNPTQIDQQFLLSRKIILYPEKYTPVEKIAQLEKAMRMTCPGFSGCKLPKVLSFEEIIILNNLAVNYDYIGNRDYTIQILMGLRDYYNRHVVNPEESLRTQPMILYNLSKALGCTQRYDECIEVCNEGIRIARETGRCSYLGLTLYNKAWSLLKRGQKGDHMLAMDILRRAYHFDEIMGKEGAMQRCRDLWAQHFPDDELL